MTRAVTPGMPYGGGGGPHGGGGGVGPGRRGGAPGGHGLPAGRWCRRRWRSWLVRHGRPIAQLEVAWDRTQRPRRGGAGR
ncbi:hypothetical protein I552_5795 [Mycobacterium xenopi 3993]|nr:hypothetical protein I552_5795 [Mycobacterium xenopi 3993]